MVVLIKFDAYAGEYLMHCHNLEHEDMGMMANSLVVDHPNTWIGITSNNWFTASNWSGGKVPGASDDVIISGGYPNSLVIPAGTTATCRSLTADPGVTVTVSSSAHLNILH